MLIIAMLVKVSASLGYLSDEIAGIVGICMVDLAGTVLVGVVHGYIPESES